ncbi:hypothetical protein Fot_14902 [Forsythia ovata]|uniref:Uncharacterized protein n=1 Tax=Forsythia ovata TaxID=205694 RepID=A0ABD1W7M4_9LAMI
MGLEDDQNRSQLLLKKLQKSIPISLSATHDPFPDSSDWIERINVGSRQDELDMAILEKLPFPSITAAGSIHNIRAREGADLLELIKMAEMNTYRSHVLNCEVYKVLAMKVDELCSMVTGAEDIDALRSKNKVIRARLAIVEDTRAQAVFKITKFEMIQRTRINAN